MPSARAAAPFLRRWRIASATIVGSTRYSPFSISSFRSPTFTSRSPSLDSGSRIGISPCLLDRVRTLIDGYPRFSIGKNLWTGVGSCAAGRLDERSAKGPRRRKTAPGATASSALARGGQRHHTSKPGEHDDPLRGAVERIAGRENKALVAHVVRHPQRRREDDPAELHDVGE